MIRRVGPPVRARYIRVYADTSVFGGIVEPVFAELSNAFFEVVRRGELTLVTSALVETELVRAPAEVRVLLDEMRKIAEVVQVTDDAYALRDAYMAAKIARAKSEKDALHVAIATVSRCPVIVSWNFRDIVNFRRIPLYNAINAVNGYGAIDIRTPVEVIDSEI